MTAPQAAPDFRYRIPPHLERLCDDAAIFPPGRAPLDEALASHVDHSRSAYRRFLGPLVVSADRLDDLAVLAADLAPRSVWLAVTVPSPAALGDALTRAGAIGSTRLAGAEIALPPEQTPDRVVPEIAEGLRVAGVETTEVYVEVPRDERRAAVLDALAYSEFDAKFRTGGIEAHLYPSETELADAICGAVTRHLPFKATAGLHHAIRNTDPQTGFEQHGFLNLFLAVDAARQGIDSEPNGVRERIVDILADRDGESVAHDIRSLDPSRAMAVRASFTSFGSCSVLEPLAELIDLDLIDPPGAS
ncbi:hypothetical protein [Mobilicoccus massiliensis]|uniref:hypothetical protein n=1 Tax=Mobilicoccus massiliensis TaxID=1522310 RepID=UPI0006942930|nr:hypothetical protein [Mobilicoccus massiliensis]